MNNEPKILRVKAVRLSFPVLFEAEPFSEGDAPRFSAVYLLDKKEQKAEIKAIQSAINQVIKDNNNGKLVKGVKTCFNDGDDKDYDGYEGMMALSVGNTKKNPPTVRDEDGEEIIDDNGEVYAGCYVHATYTLWYQDNKWGRRVNANLRAVKFYQDGEPFGSGVSSGNDEFDEDDTDDMM